jgi:beta-carotene 15,15'-dioxygenase
MLTVTNGGTQSAPILESGGVRSIIGCFACTLLVVASVIDQALVSLDFLHWPGATAALLVVMGLPHGALDIELMIHAADDPDRFSLSRSLLAYVGIILGVLLFWWALPAGALVFMLLLSAYHFGCDWLALEQVGERIVVGAALLSSPALFHGAAVAQIFSWLVTPDTGLIIADAMRLVCVPLVLGVGAVVRRRWRDNRAQCEEIVIVVGSAIILPPLTFFVIYFCALHSIRHLVEVRQTLSTQRVSLLIARGTPYAIVALVGCLAGGAFFPRLDPGAAVLSSVFVGLAALTVPHMLLCEQPRSAARHRSSIVRALRV